MTQAEFNKELAGGKRSWPNTHVPSDLNISGREIHGDVSFKEMVVDGDLDLSGTVIHGSLNLFGVFVKGNLDLTDLRIEGKLYRVGDLDDKNLISCHGLCFIEGNLITDGLVANGFPTGIPSQKSTSLFTE